MNQEIKPSEYIDIQLPSQGLVYKDFKGAAIRMLKGKDEQLITSFTVQNFERKFRDLLRSGVLIGVDADELTIGDRMFLALYLAKSCYSNIMPLEGVQCPHCLKITKIDIDLNLLEKINLPETFKEPISVKLSNGDTAMIKLMRVKNRIKYMDKTLERGDELPLYRLALLMDDERSLAERLAYLEELPAKDIRTLFSVQENNYHGYKLSGYQTVCPDCGGAFPVEVPFLIGIFFPQNNAVASSVPDSV